MEYLTQAQDFLTKTNTTLEIEYLKHGKHFADDTHARDIYTCILKRGDRRYKFNFGQSIKNSKKYRDKYIKGDVYLCDGTLDKFLSTKKMSQKFLDGYCVQIPGKKPNAYDILACLQAYPVDNFEDFCFDFGYDNDSRKAYKTYEAVLNEYNNLSRLFDDDELQELSEIN